MEREISPRVPAKYKIEHMNECVSGGGRKFSVGVKLDGLVSDGWKGKREIT